VDSPPPRTYGCTYSLSVEKGLPGYFHPDSPFPSSLRYISRPLLCPVIGSAPRICQTPQPAQWRLFLLLTVLTGFFLPACEPVDENTTGDDPRDQFIGVWQFAESGFIKSTDGQSYIVTISKDAGNSSQVILENFGNPGLQDVIVTGTVTTNQIVVSTQNLSNGWTVEGSGKMNNANKTSMLWNYTIIAGGNEDTYNNVTATKQ